MPVETPNLSEFSTFPPCEGGEHDAEGADTVSLLATDIETRSEVPYQILRSPELRMRYLQLTDGLIKTMVESGTETAIFLDKSARPVAWLVHALWDQLAPPSEPGGRPYPEPAIKFLNIDREQWGAVVGRSQDNRIDVSSIPEERIDELRKIMAPVDKLLDEDKPAPDNSLLTGKKVMVVDEIRGSGDTLRISQLVLDRAFPDASGIDAAFWMSGKVKRNLKSGQQTNTENPVWYDERKVTGRGVGNRDTTKAINSNSQRSRIGRYWLSMPFKEPDTEGKQLRQEIQQMARDLRRHRLLYMPSPGWREDIEPIDRRIKRINGISPEQYKNLRATTRTAEDRIKRLGQLAGENS